MLYLVNRAPDPLRHPARYPAGCLLPAYQKQLELGTTLYPLSLNQTSSLALGMGQVNPVTSSPSYVCVCKRARARVRVRVCVQIID